MLFVKVFFPVLILLIVHANPLSAQVKQNLAKDFDFFQQKSQEYAEWLNKTGLGKSISVDRVRMRPMPNNWDIDSTELELLLLLRTNDPDSAIGIWQALKKGFDSPEDSLEHYLYRTFVHKMEIPGEQGSIQVHIKDSSGNLELCFYLWIWQEPDALTGSKVHSEYHLKECKAKSFEITVNSPPVKTTGKSKTARVTKPRVKTADEVFAVIQKYVQDSLIHHPRYRTTECNDRTPFVEELDRSPQAYTFTVGNLCKEVMTKQSRITWEIWWGYSTIAMERLTFQFEYYPMNNGNGFTLKCVIEGKYGSGLFKPRTQGYMNMEPDFDDFFETYKNRFRNELQKRL
jgi:hypothetical protein